MGLRCSLLGHDFGDIVVERDRDERGAEIVVTERELRECARCGAETVVSENTEVRRQRPEEGGGQSTPADDATDGPGAPSITDAERAMDADEPDAGDATSLVEEAEAGTADAEQETEDAVILDAEDATAPAADAEPEPEPETESESPTDEPSATDDAGEGVAPDESADTEILDDESAAAGPEPADSEPAAQPGDAGPEQAEPADSEPAAQPADGEPASPEPTDSEPAVEPTDAEPSSEPAHSPATEDVAAVDPDEEAEVLSDSTPEETASNETGVAGEAGPEDAVSGDSEFEFAGAEAEPAEPADSEPAGQPPDAEPADTAPSDPSSGIASKGPIDLTGPTDSAVDGILVCPACDFSVPIARSSNRAGDICPECHAGYLAEER